MNCHKHFPITISNELGNPYVKLIKEKLFAYNIENYSIADKYISLKNQLAELDHQLEQTKTSRESGKNKLRIEYKKDNYDKRIHHLDEIEKIKEQNYRNSRLFSEKVRKKAKAKDTKEIYLKNKKFHSEQVIIYGEHCRQIETFHKQFAAELQRIDDSKNHVLKLIKELPRENKKDFNTRKCLDESCRGSLISNICNKCNQEVCTSCKEKKLENHICDGNTLKTIKSISNYKQCPCCSVFIRKISGCDSMFCVQCKTGFNWRTLDLIKPGENHNPHYFQWLFSQGTRGTGVAVDRRNGLNDEFIVEFQKKFGAKSSLVEKIRITRELADSIRTNLKCGELTIEKIELTANFLLGKISENEYKRELYDSHIRESFNASIRAITDVYFEKISEIFYNIFFENNSEYSFGKLEKETKTEIREICLMYGKTFNFHGIPD